MRKGKGKRANAREVVFEGAAHPFKENLLKVDGRTRIVDMPEVKTELVKAKSI